MAWRVCTAAAARRQPASQLLLLLLLKVLLSASACCGTGCHTTHDATHSRQISEQLSVSFRACPPQPGPPHAAARSRWPDPAHSERGRQHRAQTGSAGQHAGASWLLAAGDLDLVTNRVCERRLQAPSPAKHKQGRCISLVLRLHWVRVTLPTFVPETHPHAAPGQLHASAISEAATKVLHTPSCPVGALLLPRCLVLLSLSAAAAATHQQCDGSHGQSHATDEGTLIGQHGDLHWQSLGHDRIALCCCLGCSPARTSSSTTPGGPIKPRSHAGH